MSNPEYERGFAEVIVSNHEYERGFAAGFEAGFKSGRGAGALGGYTGGISVQAKPRPAKDNAVLQAFGRWRVSSSALNAR